MIVALFLDPKLSTKEEKFTPLHFAAFYSQQDAENPNNGGKGKPNRESGLSANTKILQFLVNLKGSRKVEVSYTVILIAFPCNPNQNGESGHFRHVATFKKMISDFCHGILALTAQSQFLLKVASGLDYQVKVLLRGLLYRFL